MGDLVRMPLSEIVATLEGFSEYGIGKANFDRLRKEEDIKWQVALSLLWSPQQEFLVPVTYDTPLAEIIPGLDFESCEGMSPSEIEDNFSAAEPGSKIQRMMLLNFRDFGLKIGQAEEQVLEIIYKLGLASPCLHDLLWFAKYAKLPQDFGDSFGQGLVVGVDSRKRLARLGSTILPGQQYASYIQSHRGDKKLTINGRAVYRLPTYYLAMRPNN